MLVFFDIDATLITTSRAGMAAMADTGRLLFRPDFSVEDIAFAGGIDPTLIEALLRKNGVEPTPATVTDFRRSYARRLEERLADRSKCRALPGVMDLLGVLRPRSDVVIGLLTGNFAETGSMKLRACGIDPDWFPVQVWGDESPHDPPSRDHLPGVGLERYAKHTGRAITGERVTVIGDTPNDVRCAKAHGCRALAVATGGFSVEALQETRADLVVADLADTGAIVRWLFA